MKLAFEAKLTREVGEAREVPERIAEGEIVVLRADPPTPTPAEHRKPEPKPSTQPARGFVAPQEPLVMVEKTPSLHSRKDNPEQKTPQPPAQAVRLEQPTAAFEESSGEPPCSEPKEDVTPQTVSPKPAMQSSSFGPTMPAVVVHEPAVIAPRVPARVPAPGYPLPAADSVKDSVKTVAPQPAQHLALELRTESDQRVEVRLTNRGGEVSVAVRTADPATAEALRSRLPELVQRLDEQGWRTGTSTPAAESSRPGPVMELAPATAREQSPQGQSHAERERQQNWDSTNQNAADSRGKDGRRGREAWAQLVDAELARDWNRLKWPTGGIR